MLAVVIVCPRARGSNRRGRQPAAAVRAAGGARAPRGRRPLPRGVQGGRGRRRRRRPSRCRRTPVSTSSPTARCAGSPSRASCRPPSMASATWDLDAFLWGEWHSEELGRHGRRAPADRGGGNAAPPALALRRGVRVRARAHRPRPQGDAPQPEPVRELLRPGALARAPIRRSRRSSRTWPRSCARRWTSWCELGATYIQLDAPHYPLLLDPGYRDFYESRGWPAERWLELGLELDNAVIGDHPGVTFGFHLCRGNQAGRWLVEGGYDWLAGAPLPPREGASGCCSSTTTPARAASSRSRRPATTRSACSAS